MTRSAHGIDVPKAVVCFGEPEGAALDVFRVPSGLVLKLTVGTARTVLCVDEAAREHLISRMSDDEVRA